MARKRCTLILAPFLEACWGEGPPTVTFNCLDGGCNAQFGFPTLKPGRSSLPQGGWSGPAGTIVPGGGPPYFLCPFTCTRRMPVSLTHASSAALFSGFTLSHQS